MRGVIPESFFTHVRNSAIKQAVLSCLLQLTNSGAGFFSLLYCRPVGAAVSGPSIILLLPLRRLETLRTASCMLFRLRSESLIRSG